MQRRRVKTTGKRPAAWRNRKVICPRQPSNTVEQNTHILPVLHQTLCALYHHLRNPLMVVGQLIKGRVNHLDIRSLNRLLDVGNLLGTFINQQDNHMHIRHIFQDRLRHFL